MANRRMIHKSISTSKQVNRMSDFAQLLFTWALAHADDFGCLDGDPEVVMATVIPMKRERTAEEVSAAITEWANADLVWWFVVDEQPVIQFKTWDAHQAGLNKRTKTKYTLYKDAVRSQNFREFLRISPLIEENRTELKGTEENRNPVSAIQEVAATTSTPKDMNSSSSLDHEFGRVVKLYQSEGFGDITETVSQELQYLNDEYGTIWLEEAIKESVLQNKRRLKYARSILQNWRSEGGIRRSGGVRVELSASSGTSQGNGGTGKKSFTGTAGIVGRVPPREA